MSSMDLACPQCGAEHHVNGEERLTCRFCGARIALVAGAAVLDTGGSMLLKNFFIKTLYGLAGMVLGGAAAALAGVHFSPPPGVDPTIASVVITLATGLATGLAATLKRLAFKLGAS